MMTLSSPQAQQIPNRDVDVSKYCKSIQSIPAIPRRNLKTNGKTQYPKIRQQRNRRIHHRPKKNGLLPLRSRGYFPRKGPLGPRRHRKQKHLYPPRGPPFIHLPSVGSKTRDRALCTAGTATTSIDYCNGGTGECDCAVFNGITGTGCF